MIVEKKDTKEVSNSKNNTINESTPTTSGGRGARGILEVLTNNILTNDVSMINEDDYFEFVGKLSNRNYRRIVAYLSRWKVCWASGLTRIFRNPPLKLRSAQNILNTLIGFGIIETVNKNNYQSVPEIEVIRRHKQALRLAGPIFDQVTFYRLTKLGSMLLDGVDWSNMIDEKTLESIESHYSELSKSRRKRKIELDIATIRRPPKINHIPQKVKIRDSCYLFQDFKLYRKLREDGALPEDAKEELARKNIQNKYNGKSLNEIIDDFEFLYQKLAKSLEGK